MVKSVKEEVEVCNNATCSSLSSSKYFIASAINSFCQIGQERKVEAKKLDSQSQLQTKTITSMELKFKGSSVSRHWDTHWLMPPDPGLMPGSKLWGFSWLWPQTPVTCELLEADERRQVNCEVNKRLTVSDNILNCWEISLAVNVSFLIPMVFIRV